MRSLEKRLGVHRGMIVLGVTVPFFVILGGAISFLLYRFPPPPKALSQR